MISHFATVAYSLLVGQTDSQIVYSETGRMDSVFYSSAGALVNDIIRCRPHAGSDSSTQYFRCFSEVRPAHIVD